MIFIEEKYYKIWLSLIPTLGVKRYFNLINLFKTNKNIFYANKQELVKVDLINGTVCDALLDKKIRITAKRNLQYMEKMKISIISILDKEYPAILKEIYSPPVFLYFRGNNEILSDNCISIVGCRECSDYGKSIAGNLAYNLAKNNLCIVSGLAKGIDEYSHLGALYAKGKTIAVLGSGINIIYPKENCYLANKILNNNGLIISEFPINFNPNKLTFPARNRIISGLSKGVVVVEAKKKSGSLITVDFALEQGREVFVVPRKYKFYKFRRNK